MDRGCQSGTSGLFNQVDILLVNETEARSLTGERNLVKAYRKIRALGPQVLVVKRGEYGVSLFTPEGCYMAPAFPLEEVHDPTGAGDTFAGGFLGHLATQDTLDLATLKQAILTGTVMASFTVEAFGTTCLQGLNAQRIQERRTLFSDMIQVTSN